MEITRRIGRNSYRRHPNMDAQILRNKRNDISLKLRYQQEINTRTTFRKTTAKLSR